MINFQHQSTLKLLLSIVFFVITQYSIYATVKVVDAIYTNIISANSADRPYELFLIEETEFIGIDSPIGVLPAQYLEGEGDVWLLVAHGLGGGFEETKPYIDVAESLGVPAVTYTYRNHAGAPITDKISTFGLRERDDVIAVMDYARSKGAKKFILAGMSHGGAMALDIAYEESVNHDVVGVILQSPATNVARIIREVTVDRVPVMPGAVSSIALAWTGHKNDIDWGQIDYTARVDELKVPTLVIHGDKDKSIPLQHSRDFAAVNPGLIRLEVFEGAGHVEEAESDLNRFNDLVSSFIESIR